ncbi:serine hydrolase domain-containing protein [Brevundimonas sp.]|uniref:serine hydrolase domain-containing protein n=1 Tax=Brevundimonas sp. TaxID=1871086 RepID=UPI003F700433
MDRNRLTASRRTLLLGVGALGLSGCATFGGGGSAPTIRGLDRLPRSQTVLNRFVIERKLPGVSVGVRTPDGDDVFLQAGVLAFNTFDRVTPDSLFRIFSMTKPITGTAAALLIEDGKLTLDTAVADIVPEFANLKVATNPERGLDGRPAREVMTIRHLLTHTSGLSYSIAGDGPIPRAYREAGLTPGAPGGDTNQVRDLDELVRKLGDLPLTNEPGAAYHYSLSLDVLGLVIQRVSGMAFPDFIQRRILNPVGMSDTVWRLRDGDAARLMQVYGFSRDGRTPPAPIPGLSAEDYARPVTLYSGGGGLISSTRDYLDFLSMLLNDGRAGRVRVMKAETARLIRSDILPADLTAEGGGYGFGGWVARPGHPRQGEFGWSGAAGTQGWIDPEKGFAATLMIQAMPYRVVDILSELRPALDADLGITRTT